jgi:hypothetical protein
MINECGAADEMKIGRGHQRNQRKSAPVPLYLSQIPHDLNRDLTQATAVRTWQLITQTMA